MLMEQSSRNKKIPPLFGEMGFSRTSVIGRPKCLWLIELWLAHVFSANTTKLKENVKVNLANLQMKSGVRLATLQFYLTLLIRKNGLK
jgi:hypothetical protein